ncbi:hypothetical protein M501DRAFT_1009055 [Patellaria atrata CBS 101060]|uniref:Glutamyl-tRNA amidotransferase complex subunit Gta3 domain-containing protein n=1 Tax=Patellaria atrata CBS 101060 TaxID=1346257 RepID=A0A9P4VME9_9PEZI|nr:hypothetical protein M501DRAFT_1009055 [Patellaria atrata CBS 101060]
MSRKTSSTHNFSSSLDIDALLSKPSWSVRLLLPTADSQNNDVPAITSDHLHHLLRLSALPFPQSADEEAKMANTLESQLHFVKEIRQVNTKDIQPLRSIRDETVKAEKEIEIVLSSLQNTITEEDKVSALPGRERKKRVVTNATQEAEYWNVIGSADRKSGKYFIVDSAKD